LEKIYIAAFSALALFSIVQVRADSDRLVLVEQPLRARMTLSSSASVNAGSEDYQNPAGPSVPAMPGKVPESLANVTFQDVFAALLKVLDEPCDAC
jgi:hypothetical protein